MLSDFRRVFPSAARASRLGPLLLTLAGLAACRDPEPSDPAGAASQATSASASAAAAGSAEPNAGSPPVAGPPWFDEVTASSGVDFQYQNGEEANEYAILESLGGGVGVLDYDNDGRLDLFLPGGGEFKEKQVLGRAPRLYRNLGDLRFADVTAAVGLDVRPFYSHGVAAHDYDRDGWVDLAVTGWGPLGLYHNEPAPDGGRRFVPVGPQAGFTEHLWSSSAAWGDLDGDGWADLYVCQYGDWSFEKNHPTDCYYVAPKRDVCPPRRFQPLTHKLYRNRRDGTFEDATAAVKLRSDGRGLGVVMVDVNGDRRPDIYTANDTDENFLYLNRTDPRAGDGGLVLAETGLVAGVARDDRGTPNGSMGVDAADFDNRGRPSLFVTNYESELHALYRNECDEGREFFQFCSQPAGVAAIGQTWVGWGTGFADFQNRGWQDLVIVHGHAIRHPMGKAPRRQRPVLFENRNGRFFDLGGTAGSYFQSVHNARGLALADLDDDGRIDLVVVPLNEPVAILKNVGASKGRWIGAQLAGRERRDVVGARLIVRAGDRTWTRDLKSGGSYASSGDRRLHVGLGDWDGPVQVEVAWPWGEVEKFGARETGRYWKLEEGSAETP